MLLSILFIIRRLMTETVHTDPELHQLHNTSRLPHLLSETLKAVFFQPVFLFKHSGKEVFIIVNHAYVVHVVGATLRCAIFR